MKKACAKAYYDERGAYERIFQRLDLKYVPVFAMSGPMGGSASEEFLAPMPIGEDTFALAPSGKAWNVEALSTPELPEIDASTTPAASKEATPDAKTIDNMIERANADHPRTDGREWQASDILKNVVITVKHPEDEEHDEPWREVIVVGVPGDRTVDMKRLEAQFAPAELEEATEEDLKQHPELVPGYIGPMVLGPQAEAAGVKNPVRYLIDAHVVKGSAWFTGADENEVDYYNLVYGRDFKVDGVVEAVEVRHGDMTGWFRSVELRAWCGNRSGVPAGSQVLQGTGPEGARPERQGPCRCGWAAMASVFPACWPASPKHTTTKPAWLGRP